MKNYFEGLKFKTESIVIQKGKERIYLKGKVQERKYFQIQGTLNNFYSVTIHFAKNLKVILLKSEVFNFV